MSTELLNAKIKNFSYQKCLRKELENYIFIDINDLPSSSIVSFSGKEFALSKWVSPKRT